MSTYEPLCALLPVMPRSACAASGCVCSGHLLLLGCLPVALHLNSLDRRRQPAAAATCATAVQLLYRSPSPLWASAELQRTCFAPHFPDGTAEWRIRLGAHSKNRIMTAPLCFPICVRERLFGLALPCRAGVMLQTLLSPVTALFHAQAACASAFPAASLGQLFLWLHDTALIGIEAGQALASYGVHLADRLRAASAARGKVRAHFTAELVRTLHARALGRHLQRYTPLHGARCGPRLCMPCTQMRMVGAQQQSVCMEGARQAIEKKTALT
jgi:hypothetical protein